MPRFFLSGLALFFCIQSAFALEFRNDPVTDGVVVINGQIEHGDSQRFSEFITQHQTTRINAIALNSPGGYIIESMKLANQIAAFNFPVFVASKQMCVSACFLLFAAAKHKIVFVGASIGIHNARGEDNKESEASFIMTGVMARFLNKYHVPSLIINKLLITPHSKVAWLSRSDLTSMGAKILEPTNKPIPILPIVPSPAPRNRSLYHGLPEVCWQDWPIVCPGIQSGGGRVISCLRERFAQISAGCRARIL